MPDQLNDMDLLSSEELAYIAGFFDGEGYIGIVMNHGLRLIVSITNTKVEILYWLKDLFGGSVCNGQRPSQNQKPIYVWTIVSREAAIFIYRIQPYLRLKEEQSELGLEFQRTKNWGGNNSRHPVSEETSEYRNFLRAKIMELNKRGIKESLIKGGVS